MLAAQAHGSLSGRSLLTGDQTDAIAQQYEHCGGIGFDGRAACATGLSCQKINEYYSQCLKSDGGSDMVQQWQQCGGIHYRGPTRCVSGKCAAQLHQRRRHRYAIQMATSVVLKTSARVLLPVMCQRPHFSDVLCVMHAHASSLLYYLHVKHGELVA
jgi:hypothetical protein